jgi:hypothetical protein
MAESFVERREFVFPILHSSVPSPLRISISVPSFRPGKVLTRKYPGLLGFRALFLHLPAVDARILAVYSESGR